MSININDKFDFSYLLNKKNNMIARNYNDEKPLISIVTPYYNADEYIEKTADSIFNQTFPYWEWIIVNDGSTKENTKQVLDKIQKKDKRIRVINQENAGPASARYNGAKNSNSDIIFTLDADDLIINTMLECGYFSLITNPSATWAYTPIVTFGEEKFLYNPKFNTIKEKKENLISVASFIRKDKFLEVEAYSNLPKDIHEDWYMWLTFLSKKYVPIKMNFYGFWYRRMKSGRLGTINADNKKLKQAEKFLNPIKNKIKSNVGAIQFPISDDYDFNTYPKEINIYDNKNYFIDNENKRILFMFPWSVIGGADIFNLELIKSLKENGYAISVITTEPCEDLYRYEFEKYVDEYFDLSTFLNRADWAGFIAYIIKTRNVKLVFISNSYYGYYSTPWLKSKFPDIPFVDYLHAEDWSWRDGSYPKDSVAISKFLDKTYTCTEYLKKLMEDSMGKSINNTEVVYIGADTKKFNRDIYFDEEQGLREKFKNKKIVLFPCRIVFLKRPLLMVEIIKELSKRRKDFICLVIGDGPAKQDMILQIKKYNLQEYFYFVDMKDDIRVYYKIANTTVVCSLTEGLTLTAYESMAFGVPVVTSDVGGQSELVDNQCGRIIKKYQDIKFDLNNFNYDTKEIIEFANAIEYVLDENNNKKMSDLCMNKIKNGFSLYDMKKKMNDEINELISKKSCINKDICNNIDLNARYLVIFNEVHKHIFCNSDAKVSPFKQKLRNILWKFKFWRTIVMFLKKKK